MEIIKVIANKAIRTFACILSSIIIFNCISECALSQGVSQSNVKWNPGHYMLVWRGYTNRHFDTITDSHFKGAQVRYDWSDLEPQKGIYDFSRIETDLKYLESRGKRLVIQLMDRRFHSNGRSLPDYLYEDEIYHGGTEPFKSKGGSVARLWDRAVLDRYLALLRELGSRFDKEPYFEAFTFEETAIGIDKVNAEGFTHRKYLDALEEMVTVAKVAFPHTTVIMYGNWLSNPKGALAELAEHCFQTGAGWGGPDIVPDKAPGRTKAGKTPIAGYALYRQYAGKMPLGAAVQTPSFGGKEGTFKLEELYDTGVNILRLNYIFWIRVEGERYSHSFTKDILPFIEGKRGHINADAPENIR
jgi:hypothetical protein